MARVLCYSEDEGDANLTEMALEDDWDIHVRTSITDVIGLLMSEGFDLLVLWLPIGTGAQFARTDVDLLARTLLMLDSMRARDALPKFIMVSYAREHEFRHLAGSLADAPKYCGYLCAGTEWTFFSERIKRLVAEALTRLN